jgi:UDP-GlcNAc:undecaprenyl-phosphate GlcNAc-1-phosphate transferase
MWGLVSAALLVVVLTPLVARLAHAVGAVDQPNRDRPRIHQQAVPRIGGIAIVAGILVPLMIFAPPHGRLAGIAIGAVLMCALGLVDDLTGLRPSLKLLGTVLIAAVPVLGWDMTFKTIGVPLVGTIDFGWLAYPLTILWIATVTNLVNLIDGMDALAAGMVAIACASFAILAVSFERTEVAAFATIVLGACVGFLRHNYHPAKVFMGDCGALTLGFVLGSLAVGGALKTSATIALAAPLLVLAVPILDTSFVVAKRIKYGRAPWGADHNHFYHRFLRIGFSQRRTAAYLHLWASLLAGYALLLRFVPPRPLGVWDRGHTLVAVGAGLVVIAASVWMVYVLEILKERHFNALRIIRRGGPDIEAGDHEEPLEEVLTAGPTGSG